MRWLIGYNTRMSLLWRRIQGLDGRTVALSAALLLFGLVMLLSATAAASTQHGDSAYFFVRRQLLNGVLPGLGLFAVMALVDYKIWKRFAFAAFVASITALLLVYIPGVGQMRGGALSWVALGPLGFQPSEVVKLTFLLYLAAWLAARKGSDAHSFQEGVIPFAGSVGAVVLLLVMQPDTGSMAVILGTALVLYFLSGAPIRWFLGMSLAGGGLIAFLIRTSSYRAARFMTFLYPELDPMGKGYHINQALLAIGSGGWMGVGYGESRQKFLYLPEVEADSIIAVIGEELGFVGIVLFVMMYSALVYQAVRIAREARDPFGMYLAAGIGTMLFVQFVLNVGSMTGLLPMTGVTLPFVSHGGSAMTILLGLMGLLAAIPREQSRRI